MTQLPTTGRSSGFSLMLTEQDVDYEEINTSRLRTLIRGPVRAGLLTAVLFVGAFVVWGFLVPLEGGAAAPGVIIPNSSKKTVQHLEGGVISEIRVHDNQVVKAGDPLVVIENIRELSSHDAMQEERLTLIAKQARLDAERSGQSKIDWPPELRSDTEQVRKVVEAQRHVFETQFKAHQARKSILGQRIEQLLEQIKGFDALVASAAQQLSLIEEEIAGKKTLLDKGLIPKPEYLQLRRMQADIVGRRGEYVARIANAQQTIGEAKMQLLSADADRSTQIANEADKVRAELAIVFQKLRGSVDVLKRTVVTAPVDGTILNLKFKTIGGVVQRGDPIMEIVPTDDSLIVEARVTPHDIKAVHQGLVARVRLTAYSSRTMPPVAGTVESISPDRMLDQFTREPYYMARVSMDKQQLHEFAHDVRLVPGMPADVLIVVEQRTMFQYLFKPFRDAFQKSFLEL